MDIEERVGQPVVDESGNAAEIAVPASPTSEPAPAEEPIVETPPSKYAGKSPDEMARMLEDQERYTGRLGNDLGTARQEADYWRQQAEMARQAGRTPEPVRAPQGPGWDWDKFQQTPDAIIDERVERKLAQVEQFREERDFTREYGRGKQIAMKERPEMFRGIEDKVDALIQNSRRGGFVNSTTVGDPETWYYAAGLLKLRESNFNVGPTSPTPVSPARTERPAAQRPTTYVAKEPVEFDEKSLAQLKGLGFTEERAAAILRGEPRRPK